MSPIQMVDLSRQYHKIKEEVDNAVLEVLDSSIFIGGKKVNEFAQALCQFNKVKHTIPCASGTDALQIALMALDLPRGSEIIIPVFTYVSVVEVIALLGFKPVFVDVRSDTFNIDVTILEEAITPNTSAAIPVHLFGQCADMRRIVELAEKYSLRIIEDTAQSLGSTYLFSDGSGMKAGTIADFGTTSFFPSKNLGCFGDGGALFTQNSNLAKKAKMIANHGESKKYFHECVGINSRLDAIQAAILNIKLNHLDSYIAERQKAAQYYQSIFNDQPYFQTPITAPHSTHIFHQYTLKLEEPKYRNDLYSHLKEKGIPSMIYYPIPLHLQQAYRYLNYKEGDFPVAEALSESVLSIPMHTELTESELNYISEEILSFFENHAASSFMTYQQ